MGASGRHRQQLAFCNAVGPERLLAWDEEGNEKYGEAAHADRGRTFANPAGAEPCRSLHPDALGLRFVAEQVRPVGVSSPQDFLFSRPCQIDRLQNAILQDYEHMSRRRLDGESYDCSIWPACNANRKVIFTAKSTEMI